MQKIWCLLEVCSRSLERCERHSIHPVMLCMLTAYLFDSYSCPWQAWHPWHHRHRQELSGPQVGGPRQRWRQPHHQLLGAVPPQWLHSVAAGQWLSDRARHHFQCHRPEGRQGVWVPRGCPEPRWHRGVLRTHQACQGHQAHWWGTLVFSMPPTPHPLTPLPLSSLLVFYCFRVLSSHWVSCPVHQAYWW